jgi:hypothetical protein
MTEEIEDQILSQLAAGKTLTAICEQKGMPCADTVRRRRLRDPEFATRYDEAVDLGRDAVFDQIELIADERPERIDMPNGSRIDAGYVAWQRLRAEIRLKKLERSHGRFAPHAKNILANADGQSFKVDGGVDTAALTAQLAAALRANKEVE